MRMRAILITLVFSLVPALGAQRRAAVPVVSVKATSRIPLPPNETAMPIGGVKCDGEGNIYARLLTAKVSEERAAVFRLPIEKITPDGVVVRTFRVTDASANSVLGKHLFVSKDGTVYQIAIADGGIHAVEFAKDGGVKAEVRLEADSRSVQPWDLAVFKEGGYLLTGETGPDSRTPYTAVFGTDGKLLKQIYEPEDEDAKGRAESGDARYAPSSRGNRFVSLGAVAAGSDGNVYVLRGTSPAVIYVISPKGEVVRKLHLETGGPDFDPRSIESYADRLAIGFSGPVNRVKVIDLGGNEIANYTVGRSEEHLDLACYSSQGFTFIATTPGERSFLLQAALP